MTEPDYWQAVMAEMRVIQREELFTDIEVMLWWVSIRTEAVARLYVSGVYAPTEWQGA